MGFGSGSPNEDDMAETHEEAGQQQIQEAEQSVRIFGKKLARNEFLYSHLDTR